MNTTSKTSLDFHSLLRSTIVKILIHKNFIKKIKIDPYVNIIFGKTYFAIQTDFEIDLLSVDILGSIKFGEMKEYLSHNSLCRTHIQNISSDRYDHLEIMMEINENEAKYNLFVSTISSFVEQSRGLPYDFLEINTQYSLQKELDSKASFPKLQFRKKVLKNFFEEKNSTLTSDDFSYIAYCKCEELKQEKKIQSEKDLKNYLATVDLIADVGNYCIVTGGYLQPFDLMEVSALGQGYNNTYLGYEVKTNFQRSRRPINTVNAEVVCVFEKVLFEDIRKSLGKNRSKGKMITLITGSENRSLVKYFNQPLFKKASKMILK